MAQRAGHDGRPGGCIERRDGPTREACESLVAEMTMTTLRHLGSLVLATVISAGAAPLAYGDEPARITAVRSGDEATVSRLVLKPGAKDVSSSDGTSPLHWAARENRSAIASTLLKAGFAPDPQNRFGVTPMYLPCQSGS